MLEFFKLSFLSLAMLGSSLAIAEALPLKKRLSLPLISITPNASFTKEKLLSPAFPCSDIRCSPPVILYQVKGADGKTICSAAVPSEITLTGMQDPDKKPRMIIWTIDSSKIADSNYKYGFELNYGILLLSDSNSQMKNSGGAGDEGANPSSTQFFHFSNRYLKKQTAAYLPIVLQTAPDGSVTMCAAVDPIIVNKD